MQSHSHLCRNQSLQPVPTTALISVQDYSQDYKSLDDKSGVSLWQDMQEIYIVFLFDHKTVLLTEEQLIDCAHVT